MERPVLTVITVCFNDLEGVRASVDSVVAQNEFRRLEHIVVDGGSGDGTPSYLSSISRPNFSFISEKDDGLYFAMNKGIGMAKGGYLQFLNAGDVYVNDDVLGKTIDVLEATSSDFVYGETIDVDENGGVLGEKRLSVGARKVDWTLFKTGMRICHQAMFVKTEIVGQYDTKFQLSSDFNWAIHCLKKAKKIVPLNFPVIYFEKGGLTQKRRFRSLMERFQIMAHHFGFVPTFFRHLYFPVRAFLFYLKNGWN